jgi:hypothetical protein
MELSFPSPHGPAALARPEGRNFMILRPNINILW